jgi:hypothetical protein
MKARQEVDYGVKVSSLTAGLIVVMPFKINVMELSELL